MNPRRVASLLREHPRRRVYFIQHGTEGPIKIGCSINVSKRLAELQQYAPEKLRVVGTIPGYRAEETVLHWILRPFRMHGEWFRNCPEVVLAISRLLARTSWSNNSIADIYDTLQVT